jgi:uncharacterized Zn-binding protein involved in type VI secretion
MQKLVTEGNLSQGLDGPATTLTHYIQAKKTFFKGKRVGLVGDQYERHDQYTYPFNPHQNALRQISSNNSKTFFEGIQVAREGDLIADGDKVGTSDTNFYVN